MRADVMRRVAAADAEVARAQRVGVAGELGDLVAVARERVERGRERPAARQLALAPGSVSDWKLGSASCVRYGHRQRGDVAVDGRADRAEQRQHRLRPADAVQARRRRPRRRPRRLHASSGLQPSRISGARWIDRVITAGSPVSLDRRRARSAPPRPTRTSRRRRSRRPPRPPSRPAPRTSRARRAARLASADEDVRVADVPGEQRRRSRAATVVAISSAARLIGSRRCSLPMTRSFSRCA